MALKRLLKALTECCADHKLSEGGLSPTWPGLFSTDVGFPDVTLARDDDGS